MPDTQYEIVTDRGEAVTKAITEANPGDVIVLSRERRGKLSENQRKSGILRIRFRNS